MEKFLVVNTFGKPPRLLWPRPDQRLSRSGPRRRGTINTIRRILLVVQKPPVEATRWPWWIFGRSWRSGRPASPGEQQLCLSDFPDATGPSPNGNRTCRVL